MPDLSDKDLELLRRLAGQMIPADEAYGAPGADDAVIFQEIATMLHGRAALLAGLLSDLATGSGGVDAPLDRLRQDHGAAFATVIAAVAQGYYRDDRVMRSLGMEARPPFPKGYETIQGEWALLNPVRSRPPIWRSAD